MAYGWLGKYEGVSWCNPTCQLLSSDCLLLIVPFIEQQQPGWGLSERPSLLEQLTRMHEEDTFVDSV